MKRFNKKDNTEIAKEWRRVYDICLEENKSIGMDDKMSHDSAVYNATESIRYQFGAVPLD